MTSNHDNSSLSLLLSICGAVLLVVVGGWFLLEPEEPAATAYSEATVERPEPAQDEVPEPDGPAAVGEAENAEPMDIETQLRKARLATAAEILISPRDQSALHYYSSVLEAEPDHAIANAELDTMLAGVAQTVSDHLAAGEYREAYAIAKIVEVVRPEHALVSNTQQTLDNIREQQVLEAIQQARDGDDDEAARILTDVQALPGQNADYFTAVRESIADIRQVRLAAEQDRRQRAQLAANEAREAWVDRIETAIQQGNLISPAGASARDLLAENNSWRNDRTRLTADLIAALRASVEVEIAAGRLPPAEKLLNAATELGGETENFEDLKRSLENAYVEAESNRLRRMDELVAISTVAPKYPRRAELRGISGWVIVEFTVNTRGETTNIRIKEAEPESIFDEAVVEAVQQWRFEPREYRGTTIAQKGSTRLGFRLAN